MGRAPDGPHFKYTHVYPIVRIETPIDQADPMNRITVVKVLTSQGAAEVEVLRLNQINGESYVTLPRSRCATQHPSGKLVRVTTEIESTGGVSKFVVLANQVSTSDSHAPAASR